ncbi:MAG: hypothetical protein HY879_13075 [Deltaproteobacteria bacterium]|nr:hypothetical protein [Deltaproteobacteria bacterium]
MKSKIIGIPISYLTRSKNRLGKEAVPCVASCRWLEFPPVSSGHFKDGELILLRVMTKDKSNRDKIICRLVTTRENLLDVINSIIRPSKGR